MSLYFKNLFLKFMAHDPTRTSCLHNIDLCWLSP